MAMKDVKPRQFISGFGILFLIPVAIFEVSGMFLQVGLSLTYLAFIAEVFASTSKKTKKENV